MRFSGKENEVLRVDKTRRPIKYEEQSLMETYTIAEEG